MPADISTAKAGDRVLVTLTDKQARALVAGQPFLVSLGDVADFTSIASETVNYQHIRSDGTVTVHERLEQATSAYIEASRTGGVKKVRINSEAGVFVEDVVVAGPKPK